MLVNIFFVFFIVCICANPFSFLNHFLIPCYIWNIIYHYNIQARYVQKICTMIRLCLCMCASISFLVLRSPFLQELVPLFRDLLQCFRLFLQQFHFPGWLLRLLRSICRAVLLVVCLALLLLW